MKLSLTFFTLLLTSFIDIAQATEITVRQGYIRETIPGTNVSSAYMTIENRHDKPLVLISAHSTISPRLELHQHLMAQGMMQMRPVDSIIIDANSSVVLQPSGLHIMVFDLPSRLIAGDNVEITLNFKQHPDLIVELPVKTIKRSRR